MKIIKKGTLSFLFCLFGIVLIAQTNNQTLTQTIVGRVVDKDAESPIPGANVIVVGSNPQIATSTDADGYFKLTNVPVGRVSLTFSFVGYKSVTMNGLLLSTGKELIVNPKMEENVTQIQEVQVTANNEKNQPMNKMATVSACSFSVEETERYAGSLGDPSRMAQNFAGVISAGDQRNDIVIRGNSPSGLLWELDGVPIPSPNHFSAQGCTGGPVSMLNNNVLTNSDFFTGAWPAEYNNSVSGVFDLKMRNGNTEKSEFLGEVGYGGFEAGAEGPFKKGKKASYLINYRYSTMALAQKLGINALGVAPYYQDISLKCNFPTKSFGTFSLSGIAGTSHITLPYNQKSSYSMDSLQNTYDGSKMATAILSNKYIRNNWTIKTFVSFSATNIHTEIDNVLYDSLQHWAVSSMKPKLFYKEESTQLNYQAGFKINKKLDAKNNITFGALVTSSNINFTDSIWKNSYNIVGSTPKNQIDSFQTDLKAKRTGILYYQTYAQYQHRFNEFVTFYGGVNAALFGLNSSYSVDPRASLKYQFADKQSLSIGYGHHSQLQPLFVYVTQASNGELTNENLGMTKSNHFVLGYDYQIAKNLRLKIEAYYQQLYNVPVIQMSDSLAQHSGTYDYQKVASVSMLNYGADFYTPRFDSLVNKGKGKNYGLEITLEKFFSDGFYFLSTTSLFQSKYTTPYQPEMNTVFNGNYVFNVLGGYEFKLGKGQALAVDLKGVYAGGKRQIPIDLEKSINAKEAIYDYSNLLKSKYSPYVRFDVRISYKMNKPKYSQEFAADIQNITNHQNIYTEEFVYNPINPSKSNIAYAYQIGLYPMATYRITF